MSCQDRVQEFHEAFELPVHKEPTFPDSERVRLRRSLNYEEGRELATALECRDTIAIADGLADLCYVTYGAALEFGLLVTPELDNCRAAIRLPGPLYEAVIDALVLVNQTAMDAMDFTGRPFPHRLLGSRLDSVIDVCQAVAAIEDIPLRDCFLAVHANNMTKLDANGRPVKNADGKVIKPEGYQPVNLRPILSRWNALTGQPSPV